METSILSFSQNASTLSKTKIDILTTFTMSSANTFNLSQSKILSFGTELNWNVNPYPS